MKTKWTNKKLEANDQAVAQNYEYSFSSGNFIGGVHIGYRCADKKKVGELTGEIGAIR